MIRYPSIREGDCVRPEDRLFICEECQRAEWLCDRFASIIYCHREGHGRMREANTIEYAFAKQALKTFI
ncbi:hypothetical protein [Geobacter sp. DSM 9736]|uniref:hypothetical protein n=1 Tax=Geobacter sp. DSM 9736 TaxID=1277350 RepID=UPI000B60C6D3|nr:hypothetical protein [Geobacter sp. DSM 9736]SNB48023.1 hypothetical protein SAMN06269301_3517 [Geobacter sp. DSM 9736]